MPIAAWYTSGAVAWTRAAFTLGACLATYSSRKSYHLLKVSGSSESTCVPFVNVNHFLVVPVMCSESVGQCPPVCSSSNWQAMNDGTLILSTNVTGASGSATFGT